MGDILVSFYSATANTPQPLFKATLHVPHAISVIFLITHSTAYSVWSGTIKMLIFSLSGAFYIYKCGRAGGLADGKKDEICT